MGGLNGIEIFLGYPCNQKCSFCFQKDLRFKEYSFLKYSEVIEIIDKGIKDGKKSIIFSGGEPTLDDNLLNYIEYCKKNNFSDIRVHSNGLTFSDKNILDKYISSGVTGIIISIHGFGKIHDYLVGVDGASSKLKQTFLNLLEVKKQIPSFVIDTNTVLTKLNYKNLDKLFKFLSYFPITRSQIVQLYSLNLFTDLEKQHLYVSYDEFNNEIGKILVINKNITLENFPLCKVNKQYWDNIIKRQKYNNDAYGNMGEGFEESDCTYLKGCEKCLYNNKCMGIPKDYLSIFKNDTFTL